MTVVKTFHRPEAVIPGFDGLIADTGPSLCRAFRKGRDPLGGRFM